LQFSTRDFLLSLNKYRTQDLIHFITSAFYAVEHTQRD